VPLVPIEIFEDMSVEFDFKIGINTSPTSLSSFDISWFDLEKQILLLIQKQNNLTRI